MAQTLYGIPTANHGFTINITSDLAMDVYEAEIILKQYIKKFLLMYVDKVFGPKGTILCKHSKHGGHVNHETHPLCLEYYYYY
jgi:hypothetical protein